MRPTPFDRIRAVLAKKYSLAPETISPDSTLESLGLDSLDLIELLFDVEDEFGIRIPQDGGIAVGPSLDPKARAVRRPSAVFIQAACQLDEIRKRLRKFIYLKQRPGHADQDAANDSLLRSGANCGIFMQRNISELG